MNSNKKTVDSNTIEIVCELNIKGTNKCYCANDFLKGQLECRNQ